jgi:hypothetical protein
VAQKSPFSVLYFSVLYFSVLYSSNFSRPATYRLGPLLLSIPLVQPPELLSNIHTLTLWPALGQVAVIGRGGTLAPLLLGLVALRRAAARRGRVEDVGALRRQALQVRGYVDVPEGRRLRARVGLGLLLLPVRIKQLDYDALVAPDASRDLLLKCSWNSLSKICCLQLGHT